KSVALTRANRFSMIGILNSRTIQSLTPKVMIGFCFTSGRGAAASMPHINLSTVCYTRCNSHHPFGSISTRHSRCRLYWHCTGRGRCACELCRRIRSCTSATRPLGRPRSQELSAPRAPRRGLPQELSQQERLLHWSRIEFCENHSSSVRLGHQRFSPLGTWRCTPSWLALQPVA